MEQPTINTRFDERRYLPKEINIVKIPPIKCQGIKTKLVKFIFSSVNWNGNGRWVEPFIGSGVVAFNLKPQKAHLTDTNKHIIQFYKDIQNGVITSEIVRLHLESEAQALRERKDEYFYYVRERFNNNPNSLDFLFLSRACFNGVMRFNKKGFFNVPFCKKPDRFRKAYITKIVNQVKWVSEIITQDWVFEVADWKDTLSLIVENDFVYCDPPYAGRHTDYYNSWGDQDAKELFEALINLPCGWALSTWKENSYRSNPHLENVNDEEVEVKTFEHFYHVGAQEDNRNGMTEALVIKRG